MEQPGLPETVSFGEGKIDENHVRTEPFDRSYNLTSLGNTANHRDVLLLGQRQRQPLPQETLLVNNNHPNRFPHGSLLLGAHSHTSTGVICHSLISSKPSSGRCSAYGR